MAYCIAAHFERKNYKDPTNYKNYLNFIKECMDLSKTNFPASVSDVLSFVLSNPHLNLSINIFTQFDNEIFPYAQDIKSRESKGPLEEVNLLLVPGKPYGHYFLITNLSKFACRKHSATLRTGV